MERKETVFYSKKTWNIRGTLLDFSSPAVMGILNVTPDSFYDGGQYNNERSIIARAQQIIAEGGLIIDIGGYSSRPSSTDITPEEEMKRTVSATRLVRREFPESYISIDTFRADIADACLGEGAQIINDISGGSLDKEMYPTILKHKAPYIIMHMRGTPQNMSDNLYYENLIPSLIDYFQIKINVLKAMGIKDLAIDPGFGFAKSQQSNYEILRNLNYFQTLNQPIVVGISRKSMVYKPLNGSSETAKNGTTVLNTIALIKNANILRVHDVKEAVEAITLYNLSN